MRGAAWAMALAVAAVLAAGSAAARHTARHTARPLNPANQRLLKMSASERADVLARAVGHWCIGTETFLMGLLTGGRGGGNAYWSLRCADGSAWAIQVDPLGAITAIDCASFREAGEGKECFKKF